MSNELKDYPRYHSDFYRDGFRNVLMGIVIEVFIIMGLLFAITYFIFFQPTSHYYATTTSGVILPMEGSKS